MFDSILVQTIKDKTDLNWVKPQYITFKTNEGIVEYEILKGAEAFLYDKLDLKPATSREVYKKSTGIWNELKQLQLKRLSDLDENDKNYFKIDSDTVVYLTDNRHNIIDVYDAKTTDGVMEFEAQLERFTLDITTIEKTRKFYIDGNNGLTKLVCYDKNDDIANMTYTPVAIIEFNLKKSIYRAYSGILIFSKFTFIPQSVYSLECKSYVDLVKQLNIMDIINKSREMSEQLYDYYKSIEDDSIEISARELVQLLKNAGYKFELKNDDELDEIKDLNDTENNEKVQKFFNTFRFITNENAQEIIMLSDLDKMFRYNKLTILEVIQLLSKEYLQCEGGKITASMISDVIYNTFRKKVDKNKVDKIKSQFAE